MSPNPKRYERGTYLGGHEISAISGMNPYSTVADVFATIALGDVEDISEKLPVRRGLIIEPGFIDWLERSRGITVERDVFYKHPEIRFFGGTVDAQEWVVEDGKKILILHEMTATSSRTKDLWTEDEPAKYKWIQVQFYMGLSGATRAWIHVFITDTDEIRSYPIERSDTAIEALCEEAEDFWLNHIMTKIPPDIDVTAYPGELGESMMKRIYPRGKNEINADKKMVELAYDFADARDKAKEADDKKKKLGAELRSELGVNEKANFEGGYVSWKNTKDRTSTDWQGLARDLMRTKSEDEQALAIRGFTQSKPGSRTLRVQIKKKKKA